MNVPLPDVTLAGLVEEGAYSLYGRDLDPLRTDPPRRITETLIAGRMVPWGTKSFQTVVICVKA